MLPDPDKKFSWLYSPPEEACSTDCRLENIIGIPSGIFDGVVD